MHFIDADPLNNEEMVTLGKLLTYGPIAQVEEPDGVLYLVLPRWARFPPCRARPRILPTTVAWKSPANRAWSCLLHSGLSKAAKPERKRVAAVLHDRMTETVFHEMAGAELLFSHHHPEPIATVDILDGGHSAGANKELGLALARMKLTYLVKSFEGLKRNPTDVELMMFYPGKFGTLSPQDFNASWTIDGEPPAQVTLWYDSQYP